MHTGVASAGKKGSICFANAQHAAGHHAGPTQGGLLKQQLQMHIAKIATPLLTDTGQAYSLTGTVHVHV